MCVTAGQSSLMATSFDAPQQQGEERKGEVGKARCQKKEDKEKINRKYDDVEKRKIRKI